MFKRVVIPLDGSPLARLVLDHIHYFVSPKKAELFLVRSTGAWHYTHSPDAIATPDIGAYLHDAAEKYLTQQQSLLKKAGYRVTCYVVNEEAAQAILHIADEVNADLIAMTTHGRSGLRRWALGSVAERVIHHSHIPVLLVREETDLATKGVRRILVPLDGSERSEQAVPIATTIARENDAQLLLLQIAQIPDEGNKRILFHTQKEADAAFKRWLAGMEAYLSRIAQEATDEDVLATYQAHIGNPADDICDAVDDEEIDLLVISTHGRTGMQQWYFGSVANKVVRSVRCPILLIRSVESDEETPQ